MGLPNGPREGERGGAGGGHSNNRVWLLVVWNILDYKRSKRISQEFIFPKIGRFGSFGWKICLCNGSCGHNCGLISSRTTSLKSRNTFVTSLDIRILHCDECCVKIPPAKPIKSKFSCQKITLQNVFIVTNRNTEAPLSLSVSAVVNAATNH